MTADGLDSMQASFSVVLIIQDSEYHEGPTQEIETPRENQFNCNDKVTNGFLFLSIMVSERDDKDKQTDKQTGGLTQTTQQVKKQTNGSVQIDIQIHRHRQTGMKVGRHGGQQADKKRKHVTECIMDSIKFISGREIQPGRLTDSEKEEE